MASELTFLGHSTVLISHNGTHFLTDPLFVSRIMVVKRKLPLGMEPEALPPLSGVTISHAHTDHMNLPSLKRLPRKTPLWVPKKCGRYLRSVGFHHVTELETWERVTLQGVEITALPVNHVQGRFFPWQKTGVLSYLYTLGGHNLMVAGDIDFGSTESIQEIAARYQVDTVLLPVGGMREVAYYNKRSHKKGVHIDPETALELFKLLKARYIIPIHWGAITIAKTPRDEAPRRLYEAAQEQGLQEHVVLLRPGESWSLR